MVIAQSKRAANPKVPDHGCAASGERHSETRRRPARRPARLRARSHQPDGEAEDQPVGWRERLSIGHPKDSSLEQALARGGFPAESAPGPDSRR